jgi:hypothetical protein
MITIIKIILIYFLLGALLYLYAQNQVDDELTPVKQELFLLLGFIFRIPIKTIIFIDGDILPYIKYKKTLAYLHTHYGLVIFNPLISKEKRMLAKEHCERMCSLITDIWENGVEEYEE